MRGFASDNNAGVHPKIMAALAAANHGHSIAYGDDELSDEASKKFKTIFGADSESFFVLNGTGANVLSLSAVTYPYNAVICPESAHINTDECGAPERFAGCKLLTVPCDDGKLHIESIRPFLYASGFQHHSQPRVVSISQPTEFGTVYTRDEICAIADFAHANNMLLHIDGARIANAAATLSCGLEDITSATSADFMSFGGTKNGLMYGEAVVFFKKSLAKNFKYIRKQGMQLASKMRYISAQFIAYLEDDLWYKNALHANTMTALLSKEIREIKEIRITQKVEANAIFAIIPKEIIKVLQSKYFFYVWNEELSEVRWMTSWDTSEDDVFDFVNEIKQNLYNL
ncbi:MAG: low specificity L-threonine aldolase [Prevotellaceae bacterium]|jgi:threonine aldolase|nr:low specificity L-threonine aldolase [Prevotellaceae bacterium]